MRSGIYEADWLAKGSLFNLGWKVASTENMDDACGGFAQTDFRLVFGRISLGFGDRL